MATWTIMTIFGIIIVFNVVIRIIGMINDHGCSSRSHYYLYHQPSAMSWWLWLLFSLAIIINQSCVVFVVVFHFLESEGLRTNFGAIVFFIAGRNTTGNGQP